MDRMHRMLLLGGLLAAVGCDELLAPPPSMRQTAKPAVVKKAPPKATPTKTASPRTTPTASRGKSGLPSAAELQKELDVIARAYDSTQQRPGDPNNAAPTFGAGGPSRFSGAASLSEVEAFDKVAAAIKESVDLGPTLVVWLIDRTPSAQRTMSAAIQSVRNYYSSPEVKDWSQGDKPTLVTAVVAFDERPDFLLDPTGDVQKVQAALTGMQPSTGGREFICTALKESLEKFQSVRQQERREVVLVAITDEAGDDRAVADDVLALTRRQAIPIYMIGLPAPWGQFNPSAKNPKAPPEAADDSEPVYGPESFASERIDISGWGGGYAASQASDLIDSGFGPFVLERICRGSRGKFLAIRGGGGAGMWPSATAEQFDESTLRKYAPDYVSEAEYQKLLAENKARSALVAAARLPKVVIEGSPESRFVKGTEAQNAKRFSQGQQFAARNIPPVDRLYEALAPGESDRDKLTGARWQAEYDLAMGRVCAMKARLDGYNSMIAALKRGKPFKNEGSTLWTLEPADVFETESTIKRLGERAKMYLERVVKEHPGTPWARIAEEELRSPMGWTWRES